MSALFARLLVLAFLADGPAELASPPSWSVVTVLPGDVLADIAQRFAVSAQELREWNSLEHDTLQVGRRLKVYSPVSGEERLRMRFKVKEDTSWRELSRRYGLTVKTLLALNRRKRGGKITQGQRVTVFIPKSRWNKLFLDGGIQLQDGPGLLVKHPEWAWGRPVTVRTIEEVAAGLAGQFNGSKVVVGDLSKKRGGRFPPHKGHKGGLDADIGLFLVDQPFTVKFKNAAPDTIDLERTWFLVRTLLETGRVERLLLDWGLQRLLYRHAQSLETPPELLKEYFQYPAKRWEKKGVIRHYKGHKNHLHVRFLEPVEEAIL